MYSTAGPKFWYITQSIEKDEQKRKSVNTRIYFQMKVIEYNGQASERASERVREWEIGSIMQRCEQ